MYEVLPSFILGFHGCDRAIAELVFAGKSALVASENNYDWLGHGIYFWQNNPQRAMEWANQLMVRGAPFQQPVREPAVVGAVIDLGSCLNLLDARHIQGMRLSYENLKQLHEQASVALPVNRSLGGSEDLLLRNLDCAVIETLRATRVADGLPEFQSARGVFVEGAPVYPGAGVHEFNHIQVCVRDPRCIKGYFRVLEEPSPKIVRK